MASVWCTVCEATWVTGCAEHMPVGWNIAPTAPDSRWRPQTPAVRLAQALARKGAPDAAGERE